jgi:hypothetical protein
MDKEFYESYIKMGGKKNEMEFIDILDKFTKIIVPAYCYGEVDPDANEYAKKIYETAEEQDISYREPAWDLWVSVVGSKMEAIKIFNAIDKVAAVS